MAGKVCGNGGAWGVGQAAPSPGPSFSVPLTPALRPEAQSGGPLSSVSPPLSQTLVLLVASAPTADSTQPSRWFLSRSRVLMLLFILFKRGHEPRAPFNLLSLVLASLHVLSTSPRFCCDPATPEHPAPQAWPAPQQKPRTAGPGSVEPLPSSFLLPPPGSCLGPRSPASAWGSATGVPSGRSPAFLCPRQTLSSVSLGSASRASPCFEGKSSRHRVRTEHALCPAAQGASWFSGGAAAPRIDQFPT